MAGKQLYRKKKTLGVFMDTKLNISKQCNFKANKSNSILCCIRKIAARQSEEMILSLSLALSPHLKYSVQFWANQYEKDMDILN